MLLYTHRLNMSRVMAVFKKKKMDRHHDIMKSFVITTQTYYVITRNLIYILFNIKRFS